MKNVMFVLVIFSFFFVSCSTKTLVPNYIFSKGIAEKFKLVNQDMTLIQFFSDTTEDIILKPFLEPNFSGKIQKDGGVALFKASSVELIIPKGTPGKLSKKNNTKKGYVDSFEINFDKDSLSHTLKFNINENGDFMIVDSLVTYGKNKYLIEGGKYLYFYNVYIEAQKSQKKIKGHKLKT